MHHCRFRGRKGGRRLPPAFPSSGPSVSEGCVPCKPPCQDVPCGLEFVPDEAEPEEPCPHGVFRVLALLRLRACGLHFLRHLAEREAELDVAFKLPCVEAAPAPVAWFVELEEPELDLI